MQNIASLHTDEFPALLARLPPDLDLDQLAIEHKAIQRGRKIKTGTELLRLALAHGPGGMSLRDAAGWSGMLGLGSLSNPAVKYRLDNSVEFLEAVTAHLLAARSASQALHWPGRTIRVADGTCISKPGSKGTDWRVHGVYDLGAGGFVRPDRSPRDLPNDHLPHEIDVQALVRRGVTTPIRLIILRKPPEAVEATRKTLHAQANRKQRVLDPRTLIAAEFLILGTSLPGEDYPAVEVLAAYRLRWQIELAFKRLKSLLHIDKLPARTDLGARSWLYPHLILALLCDDLSQVFLESFPSGPFRCRISAFTVDSAESRSMGTG